MNINIITTSRRVLSSQNAIATCTLNDITTGQNSFSAKSSCEGKIESDKEISSFSVLTPTVAYSEYIISAGIPSDNKEMDNKEAEAGDYVPFGIEINDLVKEKGWTNDGYYFILKSNKLIENTFGIDTFSLNIQNEKNNEIISEAKCDFPITNNITSIKCVVENLSISGKYKMVNKVVFDSEDNPKISLFDIENKTIYIEEKPKLSKGAKIGIIIGVIVFVGVFVALIVLYKMGILCKNSGILNNAAGYTSAPDKSKEIIPGEIKETPSSEVIVKTLNNKFRK